ncbi:hypothetical protein [Pectobacterium polaris]|uniref:hypothetical protein n=1 Tax=Pectobacterium polaris TaxID=2042057 RepID=UPI0032E4A99E
MIYDLILTLAKVATTDLVANNLSLQKGQVTPNQSIPLEASEITADALHAYAKIEQELTIARRTLISETVEIEEYYGDSVSGDVGAKVSATDFGVGVSAERGRVTKRVIKFTGFNAETESILNALEASLLSKLKAELSTKQVEKTPNPRTIDAE